MGAIREYDGVTGKVVWEYEIPLFEMKGPWPGGFRKPDIL